MEAPSATTASETADDEEDDSCCDGLLASLNRADYDPSMLMQALALLKKAKLASTNKVNNEVAPVVNKSSVNATILTTTEIKDEESSQITTAAINCQSGDDVTSLNTVKDSCTGTDEGNVEEPQRSEADEKAAKFIMLNGEATEGISPAMIKDDRSDCRPESTKIDLHSTTASPTVDSDASNHGGTFLDSWPDVVEFLDNKANCKDGDNQVSRVTSPASVCPTECESVASTSAVSSNLDIRFPRIVLKKIVPGVYRYNSKACPASKKFRLRTFSSTFKTTATKHSSSSSSSTLKTKVIKHSTSSSSSTSKNMSVPPKKSSSNQFDSKDVARTAHPKRCSSDQKFEKHRKNIYCDRLPLFSLPAKANDKPNAASSGLPPKASTSLPPKEKCTPKARPLIGKSTKKARPLQVEFKLKICPATQLEVIPKAPLPPPPPENDSSKACSPSPPPPENDLSKACSPVPLSTENVASRTFSSQLPEDYNKSKACSPTQAEESSKACLPSQVEDTTKACPRPTSPLQEKNLFESSSLLQEPNMDVVVCSPCKDVTKTTAVKVDLVTKVLKDDLPRRRSNSLPVINVTPNDLQRLIRRGSEGDLRNECSQLIVSDVTSNVAVTCVKKEKETERSPDRLQPVHGCDEVIVLQDNVDSREPVAKIVPVVATDDGRIPVKHKKKKHHHHHHHHDRHAQHVGSHSKNLGKDVGKLQKKSEGKVRNEEAVTSGRGTVDGSSTSTSTTMCRSTADVAIDKISSIVMCDDKLRGCTCLVRIKRLHPEVARRLTKHGYVRTGSRQSGGGGGGGGSSAGTRVPHPLVRPPSQSSMDVDRCHRLNTDAAAEAIRKKRQRREQKLELFRRIEKERAMNQQRLLQEREKRIADRTAVVKRHGSASPEQQQQQHQQQHQTVKRRRVVAIISSSDEEADKVKVNMKVRVKDRIKNKSHHDEVKPICAAPALDCGGLVDVYSSFEVDVVKDALQVDDFLLSGNSGLDVPTSFAGDDDVLLKARQVGMNVNDGSVAPPNYDDNYWLGDAVWQVVDVCSSTSDGRDDGGANDAFSEDNLNEYGTYLDDCDFRGERPPEKSSDPIPDGMYLNESRKQRPDEQLNVQINGSINPSFLNHSPVKLSPHNVMLSSSVCDVPMAKDSVPAIVVESSSATAAAAAKAVLCVPSMDSQKSNMAAAPFAMTSDPDVTGAAAATATATADGAANDSGPPSPASVQVHAVSDHDAQDSAHETDESVVTQEQQPVPSRFRQLLLDSDEDVCGGGGGGELRTRGETNVFTVWKFGQPRPEHEKSCATMSKRRTTNRHKKVDVNNGMNMVTPPPPVKVNTIAARIAQELGTSISDDMAKEEDGAVILTHSPTTGRPIIPASNRLGSSEDVSGRVEGGFRPDISSSLVRSADDLERLSRVELEELFEYDITCGNHSSAMLLFGALLTYTDDDAVRYSLLVLLLMMAKKSEFSLSADFVEKLFCAVVEMAPSFKSWQVYQQVRVLTCLFEVIKKCERPTTVAATATATATKIEFCNFMRSRGPKYGSDLVKPPANISELFNEVLRRAIATNAAELLQFYRVAIDVGMDIDGANLRSLVITFRPHKDLHQLTHDLYRMGCCMAVYPRIRVRDWPHCIKLKSFYSESEIEIIVADFISKMTKKLEGDMGFYVSRSSTKDEILTIYISVDELDYPITSKLLTSIKTSLSAATSRLMVVLKSWLNRSLMREVLQRDSGRLIVIRPKATTHLIIKNLALPEAQDGKDKSDDSDSSPRDNAS